MRFHLIYNGDLPASGSKSKASHVLRIRRELSPQLEMLWETHNALRTLLKTGAKKISGRVYSTIGPVMGAREMAAQMPDDFIDLCGPINIGSKWYLPLVRESLSLACELDILFLRPQDPGALISQGGDIDNRIKTLLDALKMPIAADNAEAPPEEGLYCLLESDTLITELDISTDRLLTPQTGAKHEVHIVIGVKLNVLQVGDHNVCLL